LWLVGFVPARAEVRFAWERRTSHKTETGPSSAAEYISVFEFAPNRELWDLPPGVSIPADDDHQTFAEAIRLCDSYVGSVYCDDRNGVSLPSGPPIQQCSFSFGCIVVGIIILWITVIVVHRCSPTSGQAICGWTMIIAKRF